MTAGAVAGSRPSGSSAGTRWSCDAWCGEAVVPGNGFEATNQLRVSQKLEP